MKKTKAIIFLLILVLILLTSCTTVDYSSQYKYKITYAPSTGWSDTYTYYTNDYTYQGDGIVLDGYLDPRLPLSQQSFTNDLLFISGGRITITELMSDKKY